MMDKDNVRHFPKKAEEEPRELTQEEIDFVTAQDQQELDGYLNKFKAVALPDASGVEEEDEEDEVVTLDFEEDGIKAYEKVAEGVLARDDEGGYTVVEDEALEEKIKTMLDKPRIEAKYESFLRDGLVSKAVGSLLRKLADTEAAMIEEANKKRMGSLGGIFEQEITNSAYSKRIELRACISGGRVNYDKIPAWAEGYIDEYLKDAIGVIAELSERE